MTQAEASKEMNVGKETIRSAAIRLGIKWEATRRTSRIMDQVFARKAEIIESGEGQKYWAEQFNTTQAYISILFKKAGIRDAQRKTEKGNYGKTKLEIARKVIGYIAENGGNVLDALRALDIQTSQPQHIRDFAKAVGFNVSHYLYAWRQYGEWLTIPGPVRYLTIPANVMVPAVCTACGNIKELNLTNAKTHRSHSCSGCVKGQGRRFAVRCTKTGETFRSIMAFAKAKGLSSRYQTARVTLMTKGTYNLNGVDYELVNETEALN
jgi:hypothetical protein